MNIDAKIEQNKADLARLVEEGERLAELDKPKLRHGDYGYSPKKHPRLFTSDHSDGGFKHHFPEGTGSVVAYPAFRYNILGNIFDDMKRNSEDLGEFQIELAHDDSIKMTPCSTEGISLQTSARDVHMTPDQAIEISQKLIQLAHEAKRKGK